jgi:hypothetical protein
VAKAVRMIAATMQLFTGEEWPDPLKSMQKTLPIVEHILSGFNIDIESSFNYESFLRPLHAAESPLRNASTLLRRSSMVAKCRAANACFIAPKKKSHGAKS